MAQYRRHDEGEWVNDKATGSVVMKWNGGDTYRGTWSYDENGVIHGSGEYYYASTGKTRSGKWVNGTFENDWASGRNIFAVVLWVMSAFCFFGGFFGWLLGGVLIYIGKKIYEGK